MHIKNSVYIYIYIYTVMTQRNEMCQKEKFSVSAETVNVAGYKNNS
jgi:hypothetical protein